VISGAAYGIDAAAHRGALAAGGVTIAVLACGVERAYPRGHDQLLERIAQEGVVVSEVPPGSAPTRWRFVKRNRLIAAMSSATVVVEAGVRSGAGITAREAANLGRHVGAVPGPVTSASSAGAHELLRQGAVCITGAGDVAELLAPMGEQLALPVRGDERPHDGLSEPDARVYEALPLRRGAPLASIASVAGLDDATVAAALGRLELLGLARHDPAGWRRAQGTHRQVNGAPA
jgi:DNA processing protein